MEVYDNLEFELYYLRINNIKQKYYNIISNIIRGSRLNEYMLLECPGHMYFEEDDNIHRYPKIETLEQFNRNKVNCMVYSLPFNEKNDELYDKLFIYYSDNAKTFYYGFIAYNTKTKQSSNRYLITGDYNDLTKALNEFFNRLYTTEIYDYYSKKYDCVHGLNGHTMDECPTVTDYRKMEKYKENRYIKYSKKYNY